MNPNVKCLNDCQNVGVMSGDGYNSECVEPFSKTQWRLCRGRPVVVGILSKLIKLRVQKLQSNFDPSYDTIWKDTN